MAEREVSLLLRGEDKGVGKIIKSVISSTDKLNDSIELSSNKFGDMADAIPNKSLNLFSKTSKTAIASSNSLGRSIKGVSSTYSGFIDKAEKASAITEATDNIFIKLGSSALGLNKEVSFMNTLLSPAAGFWGQYNRASTGAGKSLVVLKNVGSALNPVLKSTADFSLGAAESLKQMGGAAEFLAAPLEGIGKNLGKTTKGLKIASIASDLNQLGESINEFKEETLPELKEELDGILDTVDKLGVKEMLFGTKMKTLSTTATVLSVATKGLTKNASDLFLTFSQFTEFTGYFGILASSALDINKVLNNTYQSLDDIKGIGIDTTFQESALAVGTFGKNLIFSTQAAENFRNTALSAFVGFQDKLAYLTTLSSAAVIGQEKLGQSIQGLVNGPIGNMVSSLEAAEGYYDAVSAGQSSVNFLNASLKFSAATGASAADSIGALAQTHNIYRLNARDATKTAALFNATIENGVVNGAQMASGIGQLASVAKEAGIDLVELNAMFAALTKNGFSAADAFQGLMSLITAIAGQGSESAKAAQDLGIRFDFARIKAEGLVKPINELYAATDGSVGRIKTVIPDALAFRTAMALATSASRDFIDVQSKMESLDTKSLDDVFERRKDSILQRTQALQRGFQEETIAFGNSMKETFEPAITAGERLLKTFREMPDFIKNLILFSASAGIEIKKLSQAGGILGNTATTLLKTFLLINAANLVFTNSGRARLATMYDLIKNQKDYGKALRTFVGLSDQATERIRHMTGLEKSMLLTNKKNLDLRQKSLAQLEKINQKSNGSFFLMNEGQIKKDIDRAFATATPIVQEKAKAIRRTIQEQVTGIRGNQTGNLLLKQLGIADLKNTEAELNKATRKIEEFKRSAAFTGAGQAEQQVMSQNLALLEANIQKRRELLALSQAQIATERQAIGLLNSEITNATQKVQGSIKEGQKIINRAITQRSELIRNLGAESARQLNFVKEDILNQVKQLNPQIARALSNLSGKDLVRKLELLKSRLSPEQLARMPQLDRTIAIYKQLNQEVSQQVDVMAQELRGLKDSAKGRRLDEVSRQRTIAAIEKEIAVRTAARAQLTNLSQVDFYGVVGNQNLVTQVNSAFDLADEEVKKRIGKTAKVIQGTTNKILNSQNALNLTRLIGLDSAKNTVSDLAKVEEKLKEVKAAGTVDPKTIALVETNLQQRQRLAAAASQQAAANLQETASLSANTAALAANNMERAKQIKFTGPLADWNRRLVATWWDMGDVLIKNNVNTGSLAASMKNLWVSMTTGTAASQRASMALAIQSATTKVATVATGIFATSIKFLGAAFLELNAFLGPIGWGIIALIAAFVAFSKIRSHIKMLDDTRKAFYEATIASEQFTKQLEIADSIENSISNLENFNKKLEESQKGLGKTKNKYKELADLELNDFLKNSTAIAEQIRNFSLSENLIDPSAIEENIEQGEKFTQQLADAANEARRVGDEVKAIDLQEKADELKNIVDNTKNSLTLENIFDEDKLGLFRKQREKREKQQRKKDAKALRKRNDDALIYELELEKAKKLGEDLGQELPQFNAESKISGVAQDIFEQIYLLQGSSKIIQKEIDSINKGEFISDKAKDIIQAAKDNTSQAALTSDQFKDFLNSEVEAISAKTNATDKQIEAAEAALNLAKQNNVITKEEKDLLQSAIDKVKELNSARENLAGQDKIRQEQYKQMQAVLSSFDENNAATSTQKILEEVDKIKVKILENTTEEQVKTSAKFKETFEQIKEDAKYVANIPEELKNKSLAAFDDLSNMVVKNMNTTSNLQRRLSFRLLQNLGELSDNVDTFNNTKQADTIEKARQDLDQTVDSLNSALEAGALTPEAVLSIADYVSKLESEIKATGDKGLIAKFDQIQELFQLILKAETTVADQQIEINKRAIEEITHLEELGTIDSLEAGKRKTKAELENNRLIYETTKTRYERLRTEQGETSQETLLAYNALIQAERQLELSQFYQLRANSLEKTTLATAKLTNETTKQIANYQRQLDSLQLINNELDRQEKLINSYNKNVITSFTFLDETKKILIDSVKNLRIKAQLEEQSTTRNLQLIELEQAQELATEKRRIQQNLLAAEQAKIQNRIAIAQKEQEINLAKINFEQEKINRKLRKDEVEAFRLKQKDLNREKDLLLEQNVQLENNLQVEKQIAETSLRDLNLKQEQAKNNGVLDVINSKLQKVNAKYKEQENIVSKIADSFNNRVGYTDNLLGLASSLTTNEKEQKRLAQIAAQTKVKALLRQQELEQRTLEIQQAQQRILLFQEKVKLRMLDAQTKMAIAEDTSKLQEARAKGDKEAEKSILAVLESRFLTLGTIEASNKALQQESKLQRQLFNEEKKQLNLKQKTDEYSALIELNKTRPDGNRKNQEAKFLRRDILNELGLNRSSLQVNNFNSPSAKIDKPINLQLPSEINLDGIFKELGNSFFKQFGIALQDNGLLPSQTKNAVETQFNNITNNFTRKRPTNLLESVDPTYREEFLSQFGSSLRQTVPLENLRLQNQNTVTTPIPQSDRPLDVSLSIAEQQLQTQKELVEQMKIKNLRKIDLQQQISVDITVVGEEINNLPNQLEKKILDTFEDILDRTAAID